MVHLDCLSIVVTVVAWLAFQFLSKMRGVSVSSGEAARQEQRASGTAGVPLWCLAGLSVSVNVVGGG